MRTPTSFRRTSLLAAVAALTISMVLPAAAQFAIYDLGEGVATHDIRADNSGAIHMVWTLAGVLYYGRIVNHALTGKVEVARGLSTVFWRPYLSVRPDGSSAHVVWNNGPGQILSHSWRDGSGWHTETVQTVPTSQVLSQATCAVDGTGIVHVMFAIWNKSTGSNAIYYKRRSPSGQWEATRAFTAGTPEHKFPMMVNDSQGRVHATWCVVGKSGVYTFDALCSSASAGGSLVGAPVSKIPKGSNVSFNSYGDLYVDEDGVMHRAIGGWSNALAKMCIDYSKKSPGGSFSSSTRASLGFLNLKGGDPVPTVVAGENGGAVVAWAQYSASGAKEIKASVYDPLARSWAVYTIDPAAGFSTGPNAYRVAMAKTSTEIFGIWRGGDGHIRLFVMPISGNSLALTSPNGGESWRAGDTHNITWSQKELSGVATLALYKGGTKAADIDTVIVTAGTYEWTIPRTTAAGTNYKVRITQDSIVDESNGNFTIVEANSPNIALSPTSLKFGVETSGAKTGAQQVLLTDAKGGTLHWTASCSEDWLTVSPESGTGNELLTIGVDPKAYTAGTYAGTVSIADPDALNSPQKVSVTMEVFASTAVPIGAFQSPNDGSGVRGTVPLSGWALDDLEVVKLEIRRAPVAADPPETIGGDGLVYLGDAGFVAGARPDIESLHANYPLSNRAAWGFMLNTYSLPDQGNGAFVLHAVAHDREGNSVDLGTRTINASDRRNTKPFGVIDAPEWGETVSGTCTNTAWMLTPLPNIINIKGSSISVWIDGVKGGHPVYNLYRADIANAFPLLLNKGGAGGKYIFDSTKYKNALHTIKWVATDSGGGVGDTGTSYFTVLNYQSGAGAALASAGATKASASQTAVIGRLSDLAGIPQDNSSPVLWRTGFGTEESFRPAFPDGLGAAEVVLEADGLVQVRLDGPGKGYLIVGDELRPLPAGATLDPVVGTFSWMPGPGFLGRYDLVFVSRAADGFPVKRCVTVRIVPARSAE